MECQICQVSAFALKIRADQFQPELLDITKGAECAIVGKDALVSNCNSVKARMTLF